MSRDLLGKHEVVQVLKGSGKEQTVLGCNTNSSQPAEEPEEIPRCLQCKETWLPRLWSRRSPRTATLSLTFPRPLLRHPERCRGLRCSGSCLCHAPSALCPSQGCVALPQSSLIHPGHPRSRQAD